MELIIEKGNLSQVKDLTKEDTNIIIPDDVLAIGHSAFFSCKNIQKIKLPQTIKIIGECAFQDCYNLGSINIPSSVQIIENYAFSRCKKLETITLPKSLISIGYGIFSNCSSLREVKISEGITSLPTHLFDDCKKLEIVRLPKTITDIHTDTFYQCSNIKQLYFNNPMNLMSKPIIKISKKLPYCYLNKETGEMLISKFKSYDDNLEELNYKKYMLYAKNNKSKAIFLSILFTEKEMENLHYIKNIIPDILENDLTEDNYLSVLNSLKNTKEFNNLMKRLNENETFNQESLYDLYKFAHILGVFSDNYIERQKACEFIANIFDKKLFNAKTIHESFKTLKFKEFDRELAKFILNKDNFSTLIYKETYNRGYISNICNNFYDIREYGRSNKGDQKYHVVTLDMCSQYLGKVRFENVTASTIDISSLVSLYTNNQNSFDEASKIRKEYIRLKAKGEIDDHILHEELKEHVFIDLEQIRHDCVEDMEEVLKKLRQISNSVFTYEFLSKYDPRNFILGKYCSCCAHLEGAGKGVMKTSILHPDCQNLVIRNKSGSIIAKSTLYINREQGYGVFNNIEINDHYEKDKEVKNEIYLKYLKAIEDFAREYNKKNPNKPLKQINVGMHMNDLSFEIRTRLNESETILIGAPIDGQDNSFIGCARNDQYIVWPQEKAIKKK